MKVQPALLRLVNLALFALLVCTGVFTFLSWIDIKPAVLPEPAPKQNFVLPHSFLPAPQAFEAVGEPFMHLNKNEIKLALPDLRTTLIYFGSTVRPDYSESAEVVQLGIRGIQTPVPVTVGTPVYLKYESKGNAGKWSFSPDNAPTSIWIEVKPQDVQPPVCDVFVYMTDSEGNKIEEPKEFGFFSIAQTNLPYTNQGANAFEVAGQRADSSLLIRQKCVWFGQDLFLQELGDENTAFAFKKERLDFLDPENSYFCFVGLGDCLAFADGRWHEVEPGEDSRGLPLLVAKKIDEKSIVFDLWDPKGKVRIPLEVRKATAMPGFASKFDLKLVGARSRKDWIAELSGVRMLIRENDWLVFEDNAWRKIASAEELDDFIIGNIRGPLLVIEGTEKVGNDVGLVGRLFDLTRTQVVPLRISLFKSWEEAAAADPKAAKTAESDADEDAEEDDDDDDDEEDDDDDDDDDEE
ncbi:MAG: hypothetical protein LLF94_07485 [Chlamydiales bacterium]|nr:hypothetical protein [Chlamydiales bacterium]